MGVSPMTHRRIAVTRATSASEKDVRDGFFSFAHMAVVRRCRFGHICLRLHLYMHAYPLTKEIRLKNI